MGKHHKSKCCPNPAEPGPCDVGFCEAEIELNGGLSKLVIVYPIEQGKVPRWRQPTLKASDTYKTFGNEFFTGFEPTSQFCLDSPLKAVENGVIKCGQFPLTIHIHGGPSSNVANPYPVYSYIPTMEHLASWGIVSVAFNRTPASIAGGVENVSKVIDYMHNVFKYKQNLDKSKTVTIGGSAGSVESAGAAGALISLGIPADPRVTGTAQYEGLFAEEAPGIYEDMSVPSLFFGRQPNVENEGAWNYTQTMAVAVNSLPRYYVNVVQAGHLAYDTYSFDLINKNRDISLINSSSQNDPLSFPLNMDQTDPFGDSYFLSLDPNGRLAFALWNIAQFNFGAPPTFPIEGLNLTPTTLVGVDSKYLDSDLDNDHFADPAKNIRGVSPGPSGVPNQVPLQENLVTDMCYPLTQAQYDAPDTLVGAGIKIIDGTGAIQGRTIVAWSGAPDYVATVDSDWSVFPDNTSSYIVATSVSGPSVKALNGTFVDYPKLGADEQAKIYRLYLTSFVKATICKDKHFSKFLTQECAKELASLGVTSLESVDPGHCHKGLAKSQAPSAASLNVAKKTGAVGISQDKLNFLSWTRP